MRTEKRDKGFDIIRAIRVHLWLNKGTMSDNIAIRVENLSKVYKLYNSPVDRLKESLHPLRRRYHHDFYALNDVTFEIKKGESVGIIGKNGSGKSTLLKILTGVLTPTSGKVSVNGKVSALLELGAGFNPELTGLENVYFNGMLMGYSREEMDERLDDILSFADIGEFVQQPVKTYSSGMFVRLAFAVAVNVEPEILIIDEALAVGDLAFQAKCFDKIHRMKATGTTILFVTHSMSTFLQLCNHGFLLNDGVVIASGEPKDISTIYNKLVNEMMSIAKINTEKHEYRRKEIAQSNSLIDLSKFNVEHKYGTSEAEILEVKVFNHLGQESLALETGNCFRISLKIYFHKEVSNLSVAVMIRTIQGLNLLGIHSFHDKLAEIKNNKCGDCLCVYLESIMLLNPGKYLIHVGIADVINDYEFTILDSRNNIAELEVYGRAVSFGLIHNPGKIHIEKCNSN